MSTTQPTIFVTGATGRLGGKVITNLITSGRKENVIAFVRDAQRANILRTHGVSIVEGDYMQPAIIEDMLKSVDVLVLVSSPDTEQMTHHHTNIITAARRAGVQHIIYTSVLHPLVTDPHFEATHHHVATERLLVESGISYTIMRNGFYLEVIPQLLGDFLETGIILYPAGGGKLTSASIDDIAEAIALIAREPTRHSNKIYEIGASYGYTFTDIAAILSDILHRKITYVSMPIVDMTAELEVKGLPKSMVHMITSGAEAIAANELFYPSDDLQNILGHVPKTTSEYLRETFKSQGVS